MSGGMARRALATEKPSPVKTRCQLFGVLICVNCSSGLEAKVCGRKACFFYGRKPFVPTDEHSRETRRVVESRMDALGLRAHQVETPEEGA